MAEETKIIRIVIDASKAKSGGDEATRALERMERAQGGVTASFTRLEGVFRSFFGAYLGMSGVNAIIRAADAFTTFSNALRVAGVQGEAMATVQGRLYAAANKNGVEVGTLGQVYSRLAMSSRELGANQSDILKFTDGVTAALRVQGGSAQAASGALLQLSQAMGAGVVRAEEFNSILEGALPIAQAAARGMDGMGGSVAKLRAAVIAGTVTSREFFDALLKGFDQTKVQAESASLTIGGALTGLNNNFERFVGGIDQATGASGTMVSVIERLSKGLENLGNIARAARGDVLAMFAIAANPASLINMAFAKSPAESIASEIDKQRNLISGTEDALGKLGPNDSRRRYTEQTLAKARDALSNLERQQTVLSVGGKALPALSDDPDNIGLVIKRPPVPPITTKKGAGGGDANRYAEALQDAQRGMDEARAFAEAAGQGADAVARMEVRFKALKTSQDVFSKTANDNSGAAKALAASLEETGLATLKLKNLGDFRADTATLRDQNEILEAEVRLANELPDIRAREIAQLKVMQEVRAKGLSDNKEDIADRLAVVETNERLKAQGEEIRRSTELWTAPLKKALESIQTTAADAFEGMLNSGKLNFEELGQVFKKMVVRMAAEFLALATVRPVMSVILNAVSPGMASTMGVGGASGGGGFSMPSIGGGGMFGGGGIGGMFGGVSDFLQRPVASLFPSAAPAGGYADVGALLASGNTGASAAQSGIGGLGGLSIGQGLGGIAGIGMGAYTLANSKGTGSTISGIGQMVGGAVSLIPGFGQIAGPLIMLASSIAGGLIGDGGGQRTHSSTNASLRYGGGNWYTTGGAYGAGANSGQSESALRGLTGGIESVFGLLGGVKDPSKVWGLDASSWTAQGKDWSYTSNATHLVDPATGQQEAWRMNMDDMMDTGAAQVAIRSIMGGAVGEISATMKTALAAMGAASMGIEETAKSILFVDEVYERFGKGALTVRTQFRELESQFSEMTETARKLGLSLAPVEAEQKKQTERLGQDYIDTLIDPVAAQLRAFADEKASILANVDYIAQHTDVVVDMARINEALLRKEAALKEQLYGGAISQLEDAIRRLMPGGNLSNLDPSGTLAGMRASYQSTYAQAAAGDAGAIGRFGAESTAYAEYARSYFAGSAEYEAIRQQIVDALRTVQASVVGPVTPSEGGTVPASNGNDAQIQLLVATVQSLTEELRQERSESAQLRGLMTRLVANGGR